MALKKLLAKRELDAKRAELTKLKTREEAIQTRESALAVRTADAEAAIEELADDAEDEAVEAVESEAEEIEAEAEALKKDKKALEEEKEELEAKIAELEAELATDDAPPTEEEPQRAEGVQMNTKITAGPKIRSGFFQGWERRDANDVVERTEVVEFLDHVRSMGRKERAVSGTELTIPDSLIGIVRDSLYRYSKLIKHVWLRPLKGTGRLNVTGEIPEGIWTEACAKLNELDLRFYQYEVDGYKVGGYVSICNATLEDSNLDLANEILDGIGQAIGLAVDKAILYGTGTKMPLGIVTRLAQASEPADYNANSPDWLNLSGHIAQATGATGEELFADMILKTGVAKPNYGTGGQFWAMNRQTRMTLMSKLVSFNASGAIVASMDGQLPIIGGAIEELPFLADGDIVGGYGSQYLLVERAGMKFDSNDRLQWIEENTLFKGTARYDGTPLRGDGFVAINIAGVAPTTTATFAPDEANDDTPEV